MSPTAPIARRIHDDVPAYLDELRSALEQACVELRGIMVELRHAEAAALKNQAA